LGGAVSPNARVSFSMRSAAGIRGEDGFLKGLADVAFLQVNALAGTVVAPGHHVDDVGLGQLDGQPALGEHLRQLVNDLAHARAVIVADDSQKPVGLGGERSKTRDALAADVHLAGVAGVVDLHPLLHEFVDQADDFQTEQGENAGLAGAWTKSP
jgi:hypothetical protein